MGSLLQYNIVRVRKLLHKDNEYYDPWHINKKTPQIGDTGTIVEIVHAPRHSDGYIVEMLENGPNTACLSIFEEEELELIEE